MNRFFANVENICDSKIWIEGDDYKHIKNVLRLKVGDRVSVCDGDENDYVAEIESFETSTVLLSIVDRFKSKGESDLYLKIYQGLPKGEKMELVIQKATELGVSEVIPVSTARSIVKLADSKKVEKKLARWAKIAEEASKQSKRGRIPVIDRVLNLKEALSEIGEGELVILLYESEDEKSLKDVLKGYLGKKVSVFIGPEGGFERDEVDMMEENGVNVVSLGQRILRTETAGIAVSSIIMYELGDLGVI